MYTKKERRDGNGVPIRANGAAGEPATGPDQPDLVLTGEVTDADLMTIRFRNGPAYNVVLARLRAEGIRCGAWDGAARGTRGTASLLVRQADLSLVRAVMGDSGYTVDDDGNVSAAGSDAPSIGGASTGRASTGRASTGRASIGPGSDGSTSVEAAGAEDDGPEVDRSAGPDPAADLGPSTGPVPVAGLGPEASADPSPEDRGIFQATVSVAPVGRERLGTITVRQSVEADRLVGAMRAAGVRVDVARDRHDREAGTVRLLVDGRVMGQVGGIMRDHGFTDADASAEAEPRPDDWVVIGSDDPRAMGWVVRALRSQDIPTKVEGRSTMVLRKDVPLVEEIVGRQRADAVPPHRQKIERTRRRAPGCLSVVLVAMLVLLLGPAVSQHGPSAIGMIVAVAVLVVVALGVRATGRRIAQGRRPPPGPGLLP